ncbi:MAG: (deoxy)nucleoside triphosphate pyrophosphohydrolase [Vicinamibacterales bacterium]
MPDTRIVVSAAVVERDGRFLVTRRLRGTHLEGYWEFPGGKCDPGEAVGDCLEREIREELGCAVNIGQELLTVAHEYAERTVELHFFACGLTGEPQALLGQEIRWVPGSDLHSLQFPPADDELIRLLARRTAG